MLLYFDENALIALKALLHLIVFVCELALHVGNTVLQLFAV
jgi:hypothetical protein